MLLIDAEGSSHVREPDLSACFIPDHKAAMILFLERVYGIDNSQLFLRLLEVGLLPDMKAAAQLDTVPAGNAVKSPTYCDHVQLFNNRHRQIFSEFSFVLPALSK